LTQQIKSLLGEFINQLVQGVTLRCCKTGLNFFFFFLFLQGDSKKDTTSKAIHSIFKNAIQLLQEKGFVFQKDDGFDKLYYVTREDKELHRKIHHIIQEDCQKPNHAEKGCHFQHILACARLSVSPDLSDGVLRQVLELLEDQSDIVSTTEHHYTAF